MPDYVRVRYRHTDNTRKILKSMNSAERKAIDKSLRRAVLIAKQAVTYRTGRLMRSIRILTAASDKSRGIVGRMGSLMPYANKINLKQRRESGRGFMDLARASMLALKPILKKEWARQVAQKQLNRSNR